MSSSTSGAIESRWTKVTAYVVIGAALIFALLPVVWMMVMSFTERRQILSYPPSVSLHHLTVGNYRQVIDNSFVVTGIRNGAIVAGCTTVIALTLGCLAAWGLSAFPFRGANKVLMAIMATQMTPLVVLLVPLYQLFIDFGLVNSRAALTVVYCSFTLPFAIWMAKGFFDTIPKELIDAARVDGMGRLQIMLRIGLPLTRTGLVAIGVFSFLLAWDEYVLASTLIQDDRMRTMPPELVLSFIGQFAYQWGPMMASAAMVSAPILILFLLFQRHIVSGLTAGAVKG